MASKANNPVFCFRCDRRVEWRDVDWPSHAVIFTSHGNYGSTKFDEVHGEQAVLVICDECIEVAGNLIQIRRAKRQPREFEELGTYREWDAGVRARIAAAFPETAHS